MKQMKLELEQLSMRDDGGLDQAVATELGRSGWGEALLRG